MAPAPNYLEDKIIIEDLMRFHVVKIRALKWFLAILISLVPMLIIILFIGPLSILYIISLIIVVLISPIIWKNSSDFFLKQLILNNLDKWKKGIEINFFGRLINSLIGLDITQKHYYYLEASVPDIDLNDLVDVIKSRLLNVTSASLGISFGIGTILKFTPLYEGEKEMRVIGGILIYIPAEMGAIVGVLIIITAISPILLFWLIPIIWTTQDANVKFTTQKQKISDISDKITSSLLRNLLGIAGLTLAFNFILDTEQPMRSAAGNTVMKYIIAAIMLFIFVCLIAGTAFLTSLIYLNKYHEYIVNKFRMNVAKYLNVNNTLARELAESEKILFYKTT